MNYGHGRRESCEAFYKEQLAEYERARMFKDEADARVAAARREALEASFQLSYAKRMRDDAYDALWRAQRAELEEKVG